MGQCGVIQAGQTLGVQHVTNPADPAMLGCNGQPGTRCTAMGSCCSVLQDLQASGPQSHAGISNTHWLSGRI